VHEKTKNRHPVLDPRRLRSGPRRRGRIFSALGSRIAVKAWIERNVISSRLGEGSFSAVSNAATARVSFFEIYKMHGLSHRSGLKNSDETVKLVFFFATLKKLLIQY
jgi:hypothetical protein